MPTTWDPDTDDLPHRNELPNIEGAPPGAAWIWGKDDQLGRLNLLTPRRVASAAKQIQTGEIVPVNLSLNHPSTPAFSRKPFQHTIHCVLPGIVFDDMYDCNTQSGTQWDGFRHFAHIGTQTFYNGCKASDVQGPEANDKCSIHHWAEHGIAGRGVLLDFATWAEQNGQDFDPYRSDGISLADLTAVGKAQGIDIRPRSQGGDIEVGDFLFVRSGWTKAYFSKEAGEAKRLATRHSAPDESNELTFGGVSQDEDVVDWLHDSYFATVAGDAPTFERWPSKPGQYLHEYLLALWGCPLGEMLDLEKLAQTCKKNKRWTFFFTSAPANVPGGIASHVNGTAIF